MTAARPGPDREQLIRALEERFRALSLMLYDTTVPPEQVDREILSYLDENVRFVDPWQEASGKEKYRLGAAGFHSMFHFDFELLQVEVRVDDDGRKGRAIVDGVMKLRQLRIYTYPLRTILTYEFTVSDPTPTDPRFLIHTHVEMWSLGDMIEALPAVGWLYKNVFRRGFSYGFLGASFLSSRLRGVRLPRSTDRQSSTG
jgi:hypothetical protein